MSTPADRAEHVRQVNANQAIEEFEPDQDDVVLQAAYVAGKATVPDLLAAALAFATKHRSEVA